MKISLQKKMKMPTAGISWVENEKKFYNLGGLIAKILQVTWNEGDLDEICLLRPMKSMDGWCLCNRAASIKLKTGPEFLISLGGVSPIDLETMYWYDWYNDDVKAQLPSYWLRSRGRKFKYQMGHITFMVIHLVWPVSPFLLIQKGQLPVTVKRICTSTG